MAKAEISVNISTAIINTLVEPICDHDTENLKRWVERLKTSDGEGWAIGEMLERAMRYIEMTISIAQDDAASHTPDADPLNTANDERRSWPEPVAEPGRAFWACPMCYKAAKEEIGPEGYYYWCPNCIARIPAEEILILGEDEAE